jgi:hypothetical protein
VLPHPQPAGAALQMTAAAAATSHPPERRQVVIQLLAGSWHQGALASKAHADARLAAFGQHGGWQQRLQLSLQGGDRDGDSAQHL